MDKNCLSYWFPTLQAADLPVPSTSIYRTSQSIVGILYDPESNQDGKSEFRDTADAVRSIAQGMGYPCFLRTGQGSGKHRWSTTCFLGSVRDVPWHMHNLIEWSQEVDMRGLPCDVWCVREFLPIDPIAVLPRYEGMPLVKEARCFVDGGKVLCWHPYWPPESIRKGWYARQDIEEFPGIVARYPSKIAPDDLETRIIPSATTFGEDDAAEITRLAGRVAEAFADDEAFSVDLLLTRRGWYVTDMALAGRSFHWPGCPQAEKLSCVES